MGEGSIVFIKPGHLEKWVDILSLLEFGLWESYEIRPYKATPVFEYPKREDIEKHYENIKDKLFFEPTIREYPEKGMVLTAYYSESVEIIEPIKQQIGDTDPEKAERDSIRAIFCDDSMEIAERENRFLRNAIHASANREEANKELKIWGKYFCE